MIPSRHSLPVYIFVRKDICSCLKWNRVAHSVEELCCLCSESIGADQLRINCALPGPLFPHMQKAGFLMRRLTLL